MRLWRAIAPSTVGTTLITGVVVGYVLVAMRPSDVALVTVVLLYCSLAISMDLVFGEGGMFSFSHAAVFGGAAYLLTVLVEEAGFPIAIAVPTTIVSAAFAGVVIGWPAAARTVGFFFAIVTFAAGQLLVVLVNANGQWTGGVEGLRITFGTRSDYPLDLDRYDVALIAMAIYVVLTVIAVQLVRKSYFGLQVAAIREDPQLARSLGIPVVRYKVIVFTLSSVLAAGAGILYGPLTAFVDPSLMSVRTAIFVLAILIIGGQRTILGPILGAILLVWIPPTVDMDPVIREIVIGVAMIAVILLAPQGVWPTALRLARDLTGRLLPQSRSNAAAGIENAP